MKKFDELEYIRVDLEVLLENFRELLSGFHNAADADAQAGLIFQVNELKSKFFTASSLSSIRNSVDTSDKFYADEKAFYDKAGPVFMDLEMQFYKLMSDTRFRNELEQKLGAQLFKIADVRARCSNPSVISDLQEENNLVSQYHKLTSSAQINFRGKTYNHSGLRVFEQDADRATRKEAAAAGFKWWEENNERLDAIFDALVKTRVRIAQKLGFNNFTELGYAYMGRTDYNANDVAAFRKQILNYVVPLCDELRERQRDRLGLDKLNFYDLPLNFLSGNAEPKGGPEWIIDNGKKMYEELSAETAEFFDYMLEYGLMDLVNKNNKRVGGYCTFLPDYKAPFIFSNFNGTAGDITVLTHEAGHAFQFFQARNADLMEYGRATKEVAEIHSMSMELFTWPWMNLFFEGDTQKFKFSHLSGALFLLPFGAAVDEFQHEVYAHPEMTSAERDAVWKKIDNQYRPHLNFDGVAFAESGANWKRIMHIYAIPFYFIDYVLAQICALQFWSRAQKDKEGAWKDYLTLCKAGGTESFLQLLKLANLSNPFNQSSIEPIIADTKAWLDLVEDKSM